MASEMVTKWRLRHLQEIKQYRKDNRQIFYLDGTWFHTRETVQKG